MQVVLKQNRINSWLLLFMLITPFVLSFSIGVVGCLLLSVAGTYLIYCRLLTKKKRVLSLLAIAALFSIFFLAILWFFPQNIIFLRLENIFTGKDTSGNGRTYEAFILAMKMLYDLDYNTFAIPNAAAETLAIFGWIGLSLRILTECFLFFYTRVWTNYYRLLLFMFIFLYQFTGSFITNIAEYVIWILAFTNDFPAFDVRKQQVN
jgi:hypothetical protein